jgi:uncharacterized protein
MLFALFLLDRPNAGDLRKQFYTEHRANLVAAEDRIAFAGPLTGDHGASPIGSLLVIDFSSREAAHRWLESEPFYCAGVYASTTIHTFVNRWAQKTGFPVLN